eukprot:jgi/Ulvmu1/11740/UM008_0153.1
MRGRAGMFIRQCIQDRHHRVRRVNLSAPSRFVCGGVVLSQLTMANSKYEYVKNFEQDTVLLPDCWIVVRVDGKGFTKFCDAHGFQKPNDARALRLMDGCAVAVMQELGDIVLAFGESDEYSFVFRKQTTLYKRRSFKLVSVLVSLFSASYVRLWSQFLPEVPLQYTPMFDARAVCYPNNRVLRDYLAWRQVDTHINNQYNTCYWALRQQGGKSPGEAQALLKGTLTEHKNELLFTQFGINYAKLPEQFRKGSVVVREDREVTSKNTRGEEVTRTKRLPAVIHVDIIRDKFWDDHPEILGD